MIIVDKNRSADTTSVCVVSDLATLHSAPPNHDPSALSVIVISPCSNLIIDNSKCFRGNLSAGNYRTVVKLNSSGLRRSVKLQPAALKGNFYAIDKPILKGLWIADLN